MKENHSLGLATYYALYVKYYSFALFLYIYIYINGKFPFVYSVLYTLRYLPISHRFFTSPHDFSQ